MPPPLIDPEVGCLIPQPGSWPVDPQDDVPINEDRLWIDGCFDFFHHGHAGVMLQSRRLGHQLIVGLHSDEDIAANKGPTVMSLAERVAAVEACRFATKCVPHAPYVTSLPWISHYGCRYVTHGDDITSDASGEDCYRFVKRASRMKIVPRTPGISTTDLVGRMLVGFKDHHMRSLTDVIEGREGDEEEGAEESRARGGEVGRRLREYAAAPNGKDPYVEVYTYKSEHSRSSTATSDSTTPHDTCKAKFPRSFSTLVPGLPPRPGQRIVYIPGAFDLFSSGHISFLAQITALEGDLGRQRGWYTEAARAKRTAEGGEDYPPAYIIVGLHDDAVVNARKGANYPIMNIFERGLCVVQCRFVHAVVFGAPATPGKDFLAELPSLHKSEASSRQAPSYPDAVYHGPSSSAGSLDAYADAKALRVFLQTAPHAFQEVNAAQIVGRILSRREEYEERQRKKGVKSVGEAGLRREELEKGG